MRKALTRAAHVLAAAGVFGLARPALAQNSMPVSKPLHGSIVRTSAQSTTWEAEAATADGEARFMEMQVEVALLANPGTFSCTLAARHTGDGVELHGYVPNKLIKEQALGIARKHCTLPIIDKLQVNGILEVRIPSANVDELQQQAEALLTEEFGKAAEDFEVKATAPGRLVLHGTCKSCEELSQVSKKLRSLNGCCAVEVHLTIKPLLRAGHMVTLVTSDGSLTVAAPGGLETPLPRKQVLAESAKPLPAPDVTPPAPVVAITQTRPPSNDPIVMPTRNDPVPPLASVKPEVPASRIPAPTLDPLPPVAKKPESQAPISSFASMRSDSPTPTIPALKTEPLTEVVKKADLPAPKPPQKTDVPPTLTMKADLPSLPPVVQPPAAVPTLKTEPLTEVVKKADLPAPKPPQKPDVPPTLTMKADVPSLPPAVQPPATKPLPPLVDVRLTPAFTPVAASVTTPSAPTVVTATLPPAAAPVGSSASALANVPAYAKQPVNNNGWQTTTPTSVEHLPTPTTVAKVSPPPGGWPPAYEKPAPKQGAYATTGVVMFDDDPLPEPAPLLAKEKTEQLKQKVTAACGSRASSVHVEVAANGIVHVHVKSVAPDKNETLTNSILMLPEMASPNVRLDFEEPK